LRQLLEVKFTGRKLSDLRTAIGNHVSLPPEVHTSCGSGALFEAVFQVIERQLEAAPPNPETVTQPRAKAVRSRPPHGFMPSPLQTAAQTALEGRAMKKQALANAVCAGEGTRLYRRNGIQELIERRLVQHKHGVGYYRPDSPPDGYIIS